LNKTNRRFFYKKNESIRDQNYCSIHFLYHDIVCSNKPNYNSSSIPFLNWQWPFSGGKLKYLKKEYFEFAKSDTDIAGAPIEVSWKLEVVPLGCIMAPHFLSAKWCLVQLCSHFLMFLNISLISTGYLGSCQQISS